MVPATILLTPKTANTDLLDHLVDVPPTKAECAQILAFFLPSVAGESPSAEDTDYGQARRELSSALHTDLVDDFFLEAVELGAELTARTRGEVTDGSYSHLTDHLLDVAYSFVIDRLVDGVYR